MTATILFKLANHTAPGGRLVDWSVFSIPRGTGTSTIFLGVVFGFLSFAGFEAASTLGEEANSRVVTSLERSLGSRSSAVATS